MPTNTGWRSPTISVKTERTDEAETRSLSNPYTYAPLTQKREIRLVKLLPLTDDEGATADTAIGKQPLRAELIHTNLDEVPVFTAISYTWGKFDWATLRINDEYDLATTTRVLEVLERMRPAPDEEEILLWIDQLCINQNDEEEKSHQIRLMRHIYGKASQTFIVLADSTHAAESSLFAIGRLAEAGHLLPKTSTGGNLTPQMSGDDGIRLVTRAWSAEDLPEPTLGLFTNAKFQADFAELLADPVFQRAWIYQEVKSSSSLGVAATLFWCHWDIFAAAVEIFVAVVEVPKQSPELMAPNIRALTLMIEDRSRSLAGRFKDWSLLHVQAQGVLLSSDQKDLTLALTTFEGFYEQLPLHHQVTVSQLYQTAAWAMLATSKTLDIWAAATGDWHTPQRLSENLPSWVPDWSATRTSIPFYWPRDQTPFETAFNAAEGYPYAADEPSHGPSAFTAFNVRGREIDTVCMVVEPAYGASDFEDVKTDFLGLQSIGAAWISHAKAAGTPLVDKPDFESIKPLMCALIAAVVNPRISDGSALNFSDRLEGIALDEVRFAYVYWDELEAGETLYHDGRPHFLSLFPRMYGSWKAFLPILKTWMRTCIGRRIVFGKTKGFGLVPRAAKAGDVVCILHGSKVPVVLRRLGRRYRLVGQCYWHGWMYGEKVDWAEDEGHLFSIV